MQLLLASVLAAAEVKAWLEGRVAAAGSRWICWRSQECSVPSLSRVLRVADCARPAAGAPTRTGRSEPLRTLASHWHWPPVSSFRGNRLGCDEWVATVGVRRSTSTDPVSTVSWRDQSAPRHEVWRSIRRSQRAPDRLGPLLEQRACQAPPGQQRRAGAPRFASRGVAASTRGCWSGGRWALNLRRSRPGTDSDGVTAGSAEDRLRGTLVTVRQHRAPVRPPPSTRSRDPVGRRRAGPGAVVATARRFRLARSDAGAMIPPPAVKEPWVRPPPSTGSQGHAIRQGQSAGQDDTDPPEGPERCGRFGRKRAGRWPWVPGGHAERRSRRRP